MDFRVKVHLINKDFVLVHRDFIDKLPHNFEYTLYPVCAPSIYRNVAYFLSNSVLVTLSNLGIPKYRNTVLVKVEDVQLLLSNVIKNNPRYVSEEFMETIISLNPEDIFVVGSDSKYNKVSIPYNPDRNSYLADMWFDDVEKNLPDTPGSSAWLKKFHGLFSLIENHPNVNILNPNGMRPGKYTVKLDNVYFHALTGSGDYDLDILVTKEDRDIYSLFLDKRNILYHAQVHYEKPVAENGDIKLGAVLDGFLCSMQLNTLEHLQRIKRK